MPKKMWHDTTVKRNHRNRESIQIWGKITAILDGLVWEANRIALAVWGSGVSLGPKAASDGWIRILSAALLPEIVGGETQASAA